MTNSSKIIYLSAAVLMLGGSSCSILQGKGKGIKANPDEGVEVTIWEEKISSEPVITPAVTDEDRPESGSRPESASVVKFNTRLAAALHGEWVIVAAGKTKIVRDEDMPYINFDANDGKVYAFNGCNYLNGSFSTPSESAIEFRQMISNLRMCPDASFQYDINAAIRENEPVEVKMEKKGRETYLFFMRPGKTAASSVPALTLRRHNMETLTGQWQVKEVNGEKDGADEANIFFDIPELRVHGNTGCNYFNGLIRVDPNRRNSISFSQMGVTGRLCENSAFETSMLVALEQVSTYSLSGDRLELLDLSGRKLMTLHRDGTGK